MRVEHTLEVVSLCPVDGLPDVYTLKVRASRTVKVEDILSEAAKVSGEKLFQEELTQRLHRALACEIETVGYHSGVHTRVVCGASE
jgi:NADPH-dependent 7-cyano-7-deazaguanine reductase QueF